MPGESVPTEHALLDAVCRANADASLLCERLQAGVLTVQAIVSAIEQHLRGDQFLDFAPLLSLMRPLALLAARLQGATAAPSAIAGEVMMAARLVPALSGDIHSREDALGALQRACEWIERNEPGHPAPLLIRRAQRLMSKSFLDIIRDLLPEGVPEVEKIAGASSD
jgi:type VI secretion system protein ImpA